MNKGWKKSDRPGRRAFGAHPAAAATDTPPIVNLAAVCPLVKDQRDTSTCTGHATCGAACLSLAVANASLPFDPSEVGIYIVGKCIERARSGSYAPLVDDGAMPADIMQGVSDWGVHARGPESAPGSRSDATPATATHEPTLMDLEADARDLLVGEYEITSSGARRVLDVRRALAAGCGVTVGFFVDGSFENWVPAKGPIRAPLDPNDPNGGGHYVYLFGYETQTDGSTVFLGRNSWGTSWGVVGDFRATEAWLCDFQVSDIYAMAVVAKEAP
jgi:hypothetical protein